MAHDEIDDYILKHRRSMSTREMGDKLGISKSTVWRRMEALRADGSIDEADEEQAKQAAERARDGVSFAVTMEDRASALCELRDVLHEELETTGGANLARVSAEYRKTLEELSALSCEMEEMRQSVELDPEMLAHIRAMVRKGCETREERDRADDMLDYVLNVLDDVGIVRSSVVDRILSKANGYVIAIEECE